MNKLSKCCKAPTEECCTDCTEICSKCGVMCDTIIRHPSEVEKRYTDYQNGYNTGKKVAIEECIAMIDAITQERHSFVDDAGTELDPPTYNIFTLGEVLKRLEKLKSKSP